MTDIVALDYDRTMNRAPGCFTKIARTLEGAGFDVQIVTARSSVGENEDIKAAAKQAGLDIVYCGGRQKQSVVNAAIWIDDRPETIPSSPASLMHLRKVMATRRPVRGRR